MSASMVVGSFMALDSFTNSIVCSIHLFYLWVFPGDWYEVYGFVFLTNLTVLCKASAISAILVEFYKKLAVVEIITRSYALKMTRIIICTQICAFLAVSTCACLGFPLQELMVLQVVPPFFVVLFSFTSTSRLLRDFLLREVHEQVPVRCLVAYQIFKAAMALSAFANRFRFWLCAVFFSFLLAYALESELSVPAVIAHMYMVFTYRICIHYGQVMVSFCLPSNQLGSAPVLIPPEQRLWKFIKLAFSVSWFCCRTIIRVISARLFETSDRVLPLNSTFLQDVPLTTESPPVRSSKSPQKGMETNSSVEIGNLLARRERIRMMAQRGRSEAPKDIVISEDSA